MMKRIHIPIIRINEEPEQPIPITTELRQYLENHPNKKGEPDYYDITLTTQDINTMKTLTKWEKETTLTNQLKPGDYIIIAPRTIIYEEK